MPDYYQRVEESTEKTYRISQSDAVGEIIGAIISIVLILNWTEILQWLVSIGVPDLVPLPNPQVISAFAPFLVMLAVASIMIAAAKLTVGKWNYILATLHTLHGALDAGLFLLLATSGYLLRHESISAWASALGRSTTRVQIGSSLGLTIIGMLIAVAVAIDSVRRWVQARRAAQFAPRQKSSQPR